MWSRIDVAGLLGCGDPVQRGRVVVVRCPLHEDKKPSCRLDRANGLWYCDPCGEGGDAIRMYMRTRRVNFATTVRELAMTCGALTDFDFDVHSRADLKTQDGGQEQ